MKTHETSLSFNQLSSLSICLPAYNDSRSIKKLIEKALCVGTEMSNDLEIIIVNDGSKDQTGVILDDLASQNSLIRVIHHEKNLGYGAALISGFSQATKDWVFYTDGDGQYDVSEIHLLVQKISPGIGLVNGFKISRADSWYRVLLGKFYHSMVTFLFGLRIRDTDCDFRLMRRSLLQGLKLEATSGAICVELVRKLQDACSMIEEVPVNHYPRLDGSSQFFSLRHLAKTVFQLPKLWIALVLLPTFRTLLPLSKPATDPKPASQVV